MIKNLFLWKYLLVFFFFSPFFFAVSLHSEVFFIENENFLKNFPQVPVLAKKCKSQNDVPACNNREIQDLINYILYHCGDLPEKTHHINKQLLQLYINTPMLNQAFLVGWSRLNNDMFWPRCLVCFIDYPLHPDWERNVSYCDE